MAKVDRAKLRAWLIMPLAFALGGCAIAMPYRAVNPAPGDAAALVVALTHARLDPARRGAFDDYTARLLDILPRQPGLVGYSVRRELFGDEVWTMTVWRDDAARAAFVASAEHRAAIKAGSPALLDQRFARVQIPAAEIPLNWTRALAVLDEQGRNY